MLYCVERLEQLLNHPEILSKHVRAIARPNAPKGVGCCEAPRGTLIHHYKIDEQAGPISPSPPATTAWP